MTEKSDQRWAGGESLPGVVTIGDPRLRRKADPVADLSNVQRLCDQMVSRLRELKGAGIAASQIGAQAAVVVIEVRKTDFFPDRPESPLYVMINPEILESAAEVEEDWEGCFSVPGLMGKVPRTRSVRVRYLTPDGVQHEEWFFGYLGRVIQHECDHLQGHVFLDRMSSMRSLTTIDNYAKFHHPTGTQQGND